MIHYLAGLFCVVFFLIGTGAVQAERPLRPQKQLPVRTIRMPAPLDDREIVLTVGEGQGAIKPLIGVNAGPMPAGKKGNADLTAAYHRMGIRHIRTHDYYGPLDMSTMYPCLDADPDLPDSYNFRVSDEKMKTLVQAGFQPYFRIGDSWNNVRIPRTAQQQSNFARAAVNVVRHYTEGKWEGMRAPIEHLEIWNEPDLNQFWPDKYENFFPLYIRMFKALKNAFPHLKIGGPAFVVASYKIPGQRWKITSFIKTIKEAGIAPDFLSWHFYGSDPQEYAEAVSYYRGQLDQNGFTKTELHLTEWNTDTFGDARRLRLSSLGASRLTGAWIAMQEAGLDMAFFYRGNDTSPDLPTFYGMFFADGREKPVARAFQLWSEMTKCDRKLAVATGVPLLDAAKYQSKSPAFKPVWFLAGSEGEGPSKIRVMIASCHDINCQIKFAREDFNKAGWKISATLLSAPNGDPRRIELRQPRISLKSNDIALVRFERFPAR
jgi:xylan 1,4-beta-xylosidase